MILLLPVFYPGATHLYDLYCFCLLFNYPDIYSVGSSVFPANTGTSQNYYYYYYYCYYYYDYDYDYDYFDDDYYDDYYYYYYDDDYYDYDYDDEDYAAVKTICMLYSWK